jgi:hypothetical protein
MVESTPALESCSLSSCRPPYTSSPLQPAATPNSEEFFSPSSFPISYNT